MMRARSRMAAALLAGSIAITLNTLALEAARLVPLATAKGGLLRLLTGWFSPLLQESGIASGWADLGAPAPGSATFQTGFHLLVGIVMALLYAYVVEPALPRGPLFKGMTYAIAVWLLNAVVVLPSTGQGFAGSAQLTLAGILWYAAAHMLFFMILALGYAALERLK
jgi:hypothetical protein